MANFIILTVSSLLAFVISLLFSNGIVPMHAASPTHVTSTICKKTRNPSFCSNFLKSADTTNLKGLATFTLNLAHNKAVESRALAKSQASKAANSKLKECYASCVDHYDNAIGNIEGAENNLRKGDYNGVNIQASGAMTEAGDCLDRFTQPPKDPSAVSRNGKDVEDICSIILVISNLLLEHA